MSATEHNQFSKTADTLLIIFWCEYVWKTAWKVAAKNSLCKM